MQGDELNIVVFAADARARLWVLVDSGAGYASLDVARVSFLFGLFGPQRWTLSAHDEISESSESTY